VVVQVLLGVLAIAMMAGLVWALWVMLRRIATRPRRTISALDARIAAVTGPAAERPVGETIVARASAKASLASGGVAGVLAWIGIGGFALSNGGTVALVVGVAGAVGCVASIRRAVRRPVQFSVSADGFNLGSGQRFVPWSEVEEIRVEYEQHTYTEAHGLTLELRRDPSVANPFCKTNRSNPEYISVSLDGLSLGWQDIVVKMAAVSGRSVIRNSAFGVSARSFATE
jgi:hypothetical protein